MDSSYASVADSKNLLLGAIAGEKKESRQICKESQS